MSISGKYMTCLIGSTVVADNYAWDVDEDAKELDRTVGADNGYGDLDLGVQRATISIKGYMDVATGQYTKVEAGQIISNVHLYRDSADAIPAYTFPLVAVPKSKQGGEVDGKIEWSATFKNKGGYTCVDDAGAGPNLEPG